MLEEKVSFKIERVEDVEPLIDELLELYTRAYEGLEEYAYNTPSSIRRYLRWLHRHDPEGMFVARDQEGRIVGFIAVDSNWINRGRRVGEIHELVVGPEARGKGLAKALIEKAIDYFRSKGLKTSGLWVGEHNRSAKKLYEKLGYKELYTKGIWIRMEKEI